MSYRKTTWKGDGDGLGALRIVRKKFPNLKIVMYGKKDKNIPKYVEFHERVFGTELKKLYSLADIFVFPSWVEGWGMPPMEAMACGTACVVTNSGGVLDYIIPDKTALVVPARNPEKLAMAIIELLTDNEKRSEITRMGYEHIKQFTWERTVEEFENILKTS